MTGAPDGWARVEEAFAELAGLPADERDAALERLARESAALAAEVRSLLEAHDRGGPVDTPPGELIGRVADELTDGPRVGARIGPFRVTSRLGRGGMGEVYLGERAEGDFEQRVAIKLVRHGFDTEELRRRFVAERRILASLDHPGIARLIDGGVTEEGRPWLAMELVEGEQIVEYCDERSLSIRARLELFRRVGETVRHAHRHLVVHRDLKPSNILVTPEGDPKLLDFGVARILEEDGASNATTRSGRWLTPEYASPEQILGEPVTTGSDVYSLGVLLYELLTGRRPIDLTDVPPHRLSTTLDETEPRAPSTVVSSSTGGDPTGPPVTPELISRVRATSPDQLRRTLAGDLDTIVLKAIRREPDRRYGSVDELLEDLRRYLAGEPVLARPDTVAYRAGKFVRRNRVPVAAAAGVLLALGAGLAGTLWQASRARAEAAVAAAARDEAEAEAARTARASSLMVDLLRLSDPLASEAGDVSARELLAAGVARAETELADEPDMQARLFAELGRIYLNVGELDRAEDLMRRAYDLRTRLPGTPPEDIALSLIDLGVLGLATGQLDSSIVHLEEALALTDGADGRHAGMEGEVQYHLGEALVAAGRLDEAEAAYTRALELRRSLPEPDDVDVAETVYGLATSIHGQGRFGESGALFREALEIFEQGAGTPHPFAVRAMLNVGAVSTAQGDFAEAEALLDDAHAMSLEVFGEDHAWTIESEASLGTIYFNTGRYRDAESILRGALARAERTVGEEHQNAAMIRQVLAASLSRLGEGGEAVALLEANLRFMPPGAPSEVFVRILIAEAELDRERLDAAHRAASTAIAMAEERFGQANAFVGLGVLTRSDVELAQGRMAEARRGYERVLEMEGDGLPPLHRYLGRARLGVAFTDLDAGEIDAAEAVFTELLAALRVEVGDDHPELSVPLLGLGRVGLARGDLAAAETHLGAALAIRRAVYPADHPRVREVEEALAELESSRE